MKKQTACLAALLLSFALVAGEVVSLSGTWKLNCAKEGVPSVVSFAVLDETEIADVKAGAVTLNDTIAVSKVLSLEIKPL